ncbi:hypothetical protein BC629DRAFT_1464807 [Irpex lacteus]|nr:hypothetical protein BC629DRAFT_1464807 [Irpex lacteus]
MIESGRHQRFRRIARAHRGICTSTTMISICRSNNDNTTFPKSPLSDSPRSGIIRRGGIRAHRKNGRPSSAGHCHPEPAQEKTKPELLRKRSASCTNLDWLRNGVEWQTIESSEHLARSDSYQSVSADGPILDIRHDCVKSSSPTVVHQQRPFGSGPLSAVVMQYERSGRIVDEHIIEEPHTAQVEYLTVPTTTPAPDTPQSQKPSCLSIYIPTSHFSS